MTTSSIDTQTTPVEAMLESIRNRTARVGAVVAYCDPRVPKFHKGRKTTRR